MRAIDPLLERLEGRSGSAVRLRDWRLFWVARDVSRVGVKDGVRAGVHAPLTIGRSFALEYLLEWDDGRISSGAAEKIGIEDPDRLLGLARQAAYEDPDGATFLGPSSYPDILLASGSAAEEARSGGERMFPPLLEEARLRATSWSFKTWSGSVAAAAGAAGVITSRGLSALSESTHASYSFWFEGRTGDGHSSRRAIGREEAAERLERACVLVDLLGETEPSFEPGTMSVLLHPDVVESLLSHFVLTNLSGERIHHGQSAFRIEQFGPGERVFAPSLSLSLEPCVPMDAGSFRFTSEGVPARPLDYIADGRLVHPILDLKYARRFGREPVPGPASFESLRLAGSPPVPLEEALGRVRRGVLVLSLLGLHTQDSTRGDFSVSSPQTLAIRDGSLGRGVKAILTGNLFQVLRDPALLLVAFEGFRTPGLLFEGSVGIDAPSAS